MEDQRTNLPLDAIHAIIEQFHLPDDAKILSICSRVCKSWLPIARNHLFSDMQLRLVQNIDGIVPRVEPNEKWVEWNGYYKPTYADPSLVQQLTITTFNGVPTLTPSILSSTLASFPRLRRLRIHFAHIPAPQSAVDTPVIRSSLDKLELWNVFIPPNDFCNLMSLFPHTRSISIVDSTLGFPASPSPALSVELPRTLHPSALSITGSEDYHSQWLELFGRSVNSIRSFRFGFLRNVGEHDQPLPTIRFIAKLKNLESLVWDDRSHFPTSGWPDGDTFHTRMTTRVQLFHTYIAPVFLEMQTLRHFSMRPSPLEFHWDLYLLIIGSLPRSVRHFEIYLTQYILDFDLQAFHLALARLTQLESVRIVVMEWIVEDYLPTSFDAYVNEIRVGLSELGTRGVLEVVQEKNDFSYGPNDDDLVCMPQDPPSP